MFRTGIGYDVHRLTEGRKCIIGGVDIPYEKGLDGHSDADVLIHALCDALLGSLAMGDIGKIFPDTDPQYKDADSMTLLKQVCGKVKEMKYQVVNIDCIIVCEKPKLAPYIEEMRKNIADTINVQISQVSVKATTTEKLGFEGREEGIAAHASVMVVENRFLRVI